MKYECTYSTQVLVLDLLGRRVAWVSVVMYCIRWFYNDWSMSAFLLKVLSCIKIEITGGIFEIPWVCLRCWRYGTVVILCAFISFG